MPYGPQIAAPLGLQKTPQIDMFRPARRGNALRPVSDFGRTKIDMATVWMIQLYIPDRYFTWFHNNCFLCFGGFQLQLNLGRTGADPPWSTTIHREVLLSSFLSSQDWSSCTLLCSKDFCFENVELQSQISQLFSLKNSSYLIGSTNTLTNLHHELSPDFCFFVVSMSGFLGLDRFYLGEARCASDQVHEGVLPVFWVATNQNMHEAWYPFKIGGVS